MSWRDENHRIRQMMILSGFIVLGVVAVVALAFHLVRRNAQHELEAATQDVPEQTQEASDSGGQGEEATTTDPDGEGTQKEDVTADTGSANTDDQRSVDQIYLVEGDEKSPSPYGKITHLSYSSTTVYPDDMLSQLQPDGLRITRNEIFARHGRMFNDKNLQDYFNLQSWYVARYSPEAFDDTCLNDVERENVNRIMEYEQGTN